MKTPSILKTYGLISAMFLMLSCTGIAQENKTPTITKTFELDEPGILKASSSGGGITVLTHSQKNVEVQAFIRRNGRVLSPSDPAVDDVLKRYDLTIEKDGTTITASASRKQQFNSWGNMGISFTIIVPREMSCKVSSSGGGVRISGVSGEHTITSSGGSVKLENTAGTTEASSSGGGVSVIYHKGDIHLSSSGGSVKIEETTGNVYAHSSGGAVRINNIAGDVDAGSSGGGVSITGECGYVKASSSGGSVRIDINNLSRGLHLASSGGGVDAVIRNGDRLGLDLDLNSDKVYIELHNFSGRSEKNRVKGTMNNGGIPVYMRSSGGNIHVRFQD